MTLEQRKKLLNSLSQEREKLKEMLIDGRAVDYADYKRIVGFGAGINTAIDLTREITNEDDDEDDDG